MRSKVPNLRKSGSNLSNPNSKPEDPEVLKVKRHSYLSKRFAPRRMRTRSMKTVELVSISDKRDCVRLWYRSKREYMTIPYQEYERYYVSKKQYI